MLSNRHCGWIYKTLLVVTVVLLFGRWSVRGKGIRIIFIITVGGSGHWKSIPRHAVHDCSLPLCSVTLLCQGCSPSNLNLCLRFILSEIIMLNEGREKLMISL